jgi:hypothetical protein
MENPNVNLDPDSDPYFWFSTPIQTFGFDSDPDPDFCVNPDFSVLKVGVESGLTPTVPDPDFPTLIPTPTLTPTFPKPRPHYNPRYDRFELDISLVKK